MAVKLEWNVGIVLQKVTTLSAMDIWTVHSALWHASLKLYLVAVLAQWAYITYFRNIINTRKKNFSGEKLLS